MLKSTLLTILFFTIVRGQKIYNPEIYNVQLASGVKYYVKKEANTCIQKASAQEEVTFHYTLSILNGENIKYFSSTRKKRPIRTHLSITGVLPTGKKAVPVMNFN